MEMVPDFRPVHHAVQGFRRDDVWMPDQVRHDGIADFNKQNRAYQMIGSV